MVLPLGVLSQYLFGSTLFLLSIFIIGIILLQRGKGGGLTGALGGLGGQSAFGVKAGDLFTRITAVAVLVWIFFCALACYWYRPEGLDIKADASSSMSSRSGSLDSGSLTPSTSSDLPPGASPPGALPPGEPTPALDIPPTVTPPAVTPPAVTPPPVDPAAPSGTEGVPEVPSPSNP